jgi:hypothetical protein
VDVTSAVRAKLRINANRSWVRADNGALRHVPPYPNGYGMPDD